MSTWSRSFLKGGIFVKEFQNEHAGQEGPGGPVPSGRTEGVSLSFAPQSFPNVQAGGAPPQEVRQEQAPVPAPAADRRQSFDFHPDPMRAVEPPPMVPAESVMAPSDFAGSKQYILSQFLGGLLPARLAHRHRDPGAQGGISVPGGGGLYRPLFRRGLHGV